MIASTRLAIRCSSCGFWYLKSVLRASRRVLLGRFGADVSTSCFQCVPDRTKLQPLREEELLDVPPASGMDPNPVF